MIFTFAYDAEGAGTLDFELNEDGIDYLIEGLEALREEDPGEELSVITLNEDGAGEFVLRRAPDDPE